jgi:hypothetical protein
MEQVSCIRGWLLDRPTRSRSPSRSVLPSVARGSRVTGVPDGARWLICTQEIMMVFCPLRCLRPRIARGAFDEASSRDRGARTRPT